MKINLKKIAVWSCIGSITATMSSCGANQQMQMPIEVFPTVTLSRGNAVVNADFAAEVESQKIIEIRSRATGYVDKILVKEGSIVKKGQVIVQINTDDYQQRVNSARAAEKMAQAQVANSRLEVTKLIPLVEKGIMSQDRLTAAKTNLKLAEASLEQSSVQLKDAKINLSYTTIVSPVEGVIGKIDVYQGSLISAGGYITNVAEKGDVFAYFSFDEKRLIDINNNTPGKDIYEKVSKFPAAEFIMADGTIYPEKGHVEVASGIINSATGSITFKGVFPDAGGVIRSGSSGKVRIPMSHEGVILVPQKATYELQDKRMVYKYNAKDSTVKAQIVEIIDTSAPYYLVSAGVEEGDVIIYDGITRVREGIKLIGVDKDVLDAAKAKEQAAAKQAAQGQKQ